MPTKQTRTYLAALRAAETAGRDIPQPTVSELYTLPDPLVTKLAAKQFYALCRIMDGHRLGDRIRTYRWCR